MSTASTGLSVSVPATARWMAAATSSAPATTGGTKSTMSASNRLSASSGGMTDSYVAAVAEPSRSIGFARLASAGSSGCRAARVSSLGSGSSSSAAAQASAQRMPRPADDGQIDYFGNVRDRRVGGHAAHRLAVPVDRVGGAGEVRCEDVAKQLPADRPAPARGTDHGHRPGLEERAQRSGDREVVALVDARLVPLRRCDRKADLELAAVELPGDLEARGLEDAEHRAVLRQDLGDEALDTLFRCERGEALEQARSDPMPLELVGHGERGLSGCWVAQAVVLADGDDPLVAVGPRDRADEDATVGPVGVQEVRHELVIDGPETVEAQVCAVLGESPEEGRNGRGVACRRRPQPQGRSIAKDHVDPTRLEDVRAHACSIVQPARRRIGATTQRSRGFPAGGSGVATDATTPPCDEDLLQRRQTTCTRSGTWSRLTAPPARMLHCARRSRSHARPTPG